MDRPVSSSYSARVGSALPIRLDFARSAAFLSDSYCHAEQTPDTTA